jgi:hypothetical protein
MVKQQMLLFCDEFGNTGARILDRHQPVLCYAYVLIEAASLQPLTDELNEIYRKDGIELCELRSAQLLGSLRGRRRYEAIGQVLDTLGANVFLSVVEKRYQACSMIAETLCQPSMAAL